MVGAGCFYWLQWLQPVFFAVALLALVYQIWLIRRHPPSMRSAGMWAVMAISLALNSIVVGGWIFLRFRYQ